ncbi:hypothetical protein ILUMI_18950, partial [Ignelater luminosus]
EKNMTEFKPFISLFKAIIDKNDRLDDVQKLFYLLKYLESDARALIDTLPLTNESYVKALKLLTDRYDDDSPLIASYIYSLIDLPVISKGNSQQLREFIKNVKQLFGSLENLINQCHSGISDGQLFVIKGLLDSGSQLSFITDELYKKLKISSFPKSLSIFGITESKTQMAVHVKIYSCTSSYNTEILCSIMPEITNNLPTSYLDKNEISLPKNVNLSNPEFNIPDKISILLEADVLGEILEPGSLIIPNSRTKLLNTKFGYVVIGNLNQDLHKTSNLATALIVTSNEVKLTNFGKLRGCHKYFPKDPLNNNCVKKHLEILSYKYILITDIRQMYSSVMVHHNFKSFQNILWRDNPEEELKCLQLQTVTWGLKPSTYLATRCLIELADKYKDKYLLAAAALENNTYIDDILCGANDIEETLSLQNELISLLTLGHFQLRKWVANSSELLRNIPPEKCYFDNIKFDKNNNDYVKTLGIQYNVQSDCFKMYCPINNIEEITFTKQKVFSFIAKIYDPLGFLGPIITNAEIIMQRIYCSKISWDETLPPDLYDMWKTFAEGLISMPSFEIKRDLNFAEAETTDLLGFCDASNVAYGCAIYCKVIKKDGSILTNL